MTDTDSSDREEQFVKLYRDFQPKISAYARRRLPEPDAADAVADTFLTAWRQLGRVPGDPLPWLYRIAAHAVANQRRRGVRWSRLQGRVRARLELASGRDPAVAAESSGALRAAWSQLPESDREVLRLAAWEGLDGRQLATVLGCSHDAARVRVHRARRRLARLLGDPLAPVAGTDAFPPKNSTPHLAIGDAND